MIRLFRFTTHPTTMQQGSALTPEPLKFSDKLDILIKIGTLIALGAPVFVALWLGYTIPTEMRTVQRRVGSLERGQNVLVALQCLREQQPSLITIQLACDSVVRQVRIQQRGPDPQQP